MKRVVTLAASLSVMSAILFSSAVEAKEKKKSAFPQVERPVSFPQAERDYDAVFAGRPAVQRVRVPGGLFISKPINDLAPQSLLARQIEIDIRSDRPTVSDLQLLLEAEGIPITVDYQSLYEAAEASGQVGSFTAASKFQEVANSVKGGTGVQNNNMGGGFDSFGGNMGNSVNSGSGSSSPNVTVEGAAAERVDSPRGASATTRQDSQFYDVRLPFRYFRGTVGELMRRLENTGNVAVWYQDGIIIGGSRRYSVSVLQQQDIVQSVVNELMALGATNVVGSVGAGQIVYSAPPRTNNELIEPYLRRMSGNMSEVTLQVALVTVAMSRSAERGFDWSALNFGLGANVSTAPASQGGSDGVPGGGGANSQRLADGAFTLSSNALNANLGDIFGINRIVSVAGAIDFLSRIGDTSVAQNVELRTLSGSPVILRSGEDIPYVSGLGAVGGGLGGFRQNTNTERLGTGLTMNVDPRYDHSSGIVTMDIGLKLVDLIEFVELEAGDELGTLTQPRTREQGVNSILRIPAGQTTILGGIRRELASDARTGPFGMFGIGSRNRQHEVFWLFAVVRPVVTVYETADSPIAPRSILDTRTTVNPYDEGSYGVVGQPGPSVPVYDSGQVTQEGGVPSYYDQGAVTPANSIPAGVTIAATPSPRGIVVPGAGTPPEVNADIPSGAVLRDPGAPGPNYTIETPAAQAPAAVPAYPVPAPGDAVEASPGVTAIPQAGTLPSGAAVPVVQGQPATVATPGSSIQAVDPTAEAAPEDQPRRSFIRQMNPNEKVN